MVCSYFSFLSPRDDLWKITFWIRILGLWACLQQTGSGKNIWLRKKSPPSKLTRNIKGTVYAKPNTDIFIGSTFSSYLRNCFPGWYFSLFLLKTFPRKFPRSVLQKTKFYLAILRQQNDISFLLLVLKKAFWASKQICFIDIKWCRLPTAWNERKRVSLIYCRNNEILSLTKWNTCTTLYSVLNIYLSTKKQHFGNVTS